MKTRTRLSTIIFFIFGIICLSVSILLTVENDFTQTDFIGQIVPLGMIFFISAVCFYISGAFSSRGLIACLSITNQVIRRGTTVTIQSILENEKKRKDKSETVGLIVNCYPHKRLHSMLFIEIDKPANFDQFKVGHKFIWSGSEFISIKD